ncbi:unnamed protein product, partial [Rotaria sordida]
VQGMVLSDMSVQPCILYGNSGTGKSSIMAEIAIKILEGLKSLFGDTSMIEITEFDEHVAQEVFHSWLERDQRCLTSLQMEWLQPKFLPNSDYGEPQPTPLFLSLLYEITCSWHSFDREPDPSFLQKKSTRGAIKYLYSKLSQKHGKILFERAMAYLRQAGGLSETELEDMLSADNDVVQSIFIHYLPPLNDESGITVYCTLKNGELRKYYATVMAYLLEYSNTHSTNPMVQEQICHLQIQDEFVTTLDETKSDTEIQLKNFPLFDNAEWISCHEDEHWTLAKSSYENNIY